MSYVDGFVIPIPKKNIKEYRRIAKLAGKVWKDHGALDYKECVGDDLKNECNAPFTKIAKTKSNETVVFSYIVYKSKAHRNKVLKQVMADPRLAKMMDPKKMPFDMKRMTWGGFKVIVDA